MPDVLETLQKLPKRCFVSPTEARKLGIETGYCIYRGMAGYVPMSKLTDEMAERFNRNEKAEPRHIEAMMAGSMFGWEVPGADPDKYENVAVLKERA